MRRLLKSQFVVALVCATGLLVLGCPNNSTFPFYVGNFTTASMTELKLYDVQTLERVNILDTPIPQNTLRVVRISRTRFADALGEVAFKLDTGLSDEVSGRITQPAGNLGFAVKETTGQITSNWFTVDGSPQKDLEADLNPQ